MLSILYTREQCTQNQEKRQPNRVTKLPKAEKRNEVAEQCSENQEFRLYITKLWQQTQVSALYTGELCTAKAEKSVEDTEQCSQQQLFRLHTREQCTEKQKFTASFASILYICIDLQTQQQVLALHTRELYIKNLNFALYTRE